MLKLTDLEPELQTLIQGFAKHPKIFVGTGAKTVFVYVANRQLQKQVESKIPEEYRDLIQVEVTGKVRPARHESAPKNRKKPRKAG